MRALAKMLCTVVHSKRHNFWLSYISRAQIKSPLLCTRFLKWRIKLSGCICSGFVVCSNSECFFSVGFLQWSIFFLLLYCALFEFLFSRCNCPNTCSCRMTCNWLLSVISRFVIFSLFYSFHSFIQSFFLCLFLSIIFLSFFCWKT